ncbi:MAG TPA: TIGR02391 family protein [Acidimicrobiales bacterium]|nr:TIGR02391 family protein [Acidimicrobiales bacterium]
MATRHEPWPGHVVEGIADVLGETTTGLSGSEIARLLERSKIADVAPGVTKRHRLRMALLARQVQDQAANCVIRFVTEAMEPVRYRETPGLFSARQDALNEVLVFQGLRINDEGKVARGARADTLSEAAHHANSLRAELRRRGVHAEVVRYCSQEVLERNAFHAALEAAKSVPDRLRSMTGERGDGAALVDATLALGRTGTPRVAINGLTTDTERDEQNGFATLCKGLLAMFRNPTAHDPRITRSISDDELLEVLTVTSMIHRRLDGATVQP